MTEIEPYCVVEDYINQDQCKAFYEYFKANEDEDPREFYGNLGLGGRDRFFDQPKYFDFDPERILHTMMDFGKKFFMEKYAMRGTSFDLNRSHVNYMHTGAELSAHTDDRPSQEPIDSLNSMTYVMGLFLNDDYEGGELVFEEHKVSLKPKAGTLVFFPGFYTRHGVNKVTAGSRINILSHFFDVIDTNIEYKPDYAVAPKDSTITI